MKHLTFDTAHNHSVRRPDDRRLFAQKADLSRPARELINAQPPEDRIDFAISLLEFYFEPVPQFWTDLFDSGVKLALSEGRVLHVLVLNAGRWQTRATLNSAMNGNRHPDDWPDGDGLSVRLCRIRQAIKRAKLPMEIEGKIGVGWRIVAHDDHHLLRTYCPGYLKGPTPIADMETEVARLRAALDRENPDVMGVLHEAERKLKAERECRLLVEEENSKLRVELENYQTFLREAARKLLQAADGGSGDGAS